MLPLAAALAAALAGASPSAAPPDPDAAAFAEAAAELSRDRHRARAIVPLWRLHELEESHPDLPRLARAYAEVARDGRALPEVRALATFRLAGVERARGNLRRGARLLGTLGFLERWTVAGPFDNEGKHAFDVAFPPEEAIDLGARLPGKVREVGWRAVPPEAAAGGFVDLGALLRPNREVTVYALAAVDAPREGRAHLFVGASGAVKVWVNGALALSDPSYHPARLDQAAVRVGLRRGPNLVLVKICHDQGALGFYLRLADAAGRALGARPLELPPLPRVPKAAAPRPERAGAVLPELERRVRAARGPAAEAAARLDLAIALAERLSFDLGDRRAAEEARRAAALAPRSVEAQLLAEKLDDDANRRRAALEAALAARPGEPRALVALARLELSRGRPHEAARLLERARASAPGWAAPRLALLQALEQVGFSARAALGAADVARSHPTHPGAVAAAARAARALDRPEEAARHYRTQLALRYDDAGARALLVQVLLDRGDLEGALAELAVAERLEPADPFLRSRRADLLASNGRLEEAERAWADALRLAPEEPELFERRGQARLRAGREREALADFQRALELRPQNPQLKELVRSLAPGRERFEEPYRLDAAALVRSGPAPRPGEDALVLGDLKVTRVFPSGLSATYVHRVVQVVTQRGADAFRRQSVHYAPDRQEVKLQRARVRKPDGTWVETFQEGERSASEPWYRLYYDTRFRTFSFPALGPGDVLEVAWRTDDVGGDNLLSDYFGDLTPLAEATRTLLADYVLLVPEGRPIHANAPSLPGLERTERPLGGGVVEHRWRARDVPAVEPEPFMPGWSEVSPFVHVSTYADWGQVARFYWGLIRDQLRPTREVRETAERLRREARAARGGEPDARALVEAVHGFVVGSTRYVGLEFGIHGYKPYRVDQVLARRFGDCKDKASLAHALLEALGVDSRIVLLRMRRLGTVPEKPASLAVFNHAILYVPSLDLWLDETASYSGTGELPAEDRGATVLVVNPGEAPRFGTVPESRPGQNRTESELAIDLAPDGGALARGRSVVTGVRAPEYRRAYQAEHDRRALLEQAFSSTFPGLRVEELEVSDPGRIEEPVVLSFTLGIPRLARREGGGLTLAPFGASHTYAETYAALSSRRYDLDLGEPWENRFRYRYRLPAGMAPAEVPPPERVEAPFGSFEISVRADGAELAAEGRIEFRTGRIAAADYPAFRSFVSRLDRAMARPVRIAPAPSARAAP